MGNIDIFAWSFVVCYDGWMDELEVGGLYRIYEEYNFLSNYTRFNSSKGKYGVFVYNKDYTEGIRLPIGDIVMYLGIDLNGTDEKVIGWSVLYMNKVYYFSVLRNNLELIVFEKVDKE